MSAIYFQKMHYHNSAQRTTMRFPRALYSVSQETALLILLKELMEADSDAIVMLSITAVNLHSNEAISTRRNILVTNIWENNTIIVSSSGSLNREPITP